MSCRASVNMVKRAAAGARPLVCLPPVFEPFDIPKQATRRVSSSAVAAKRDPGRFFAMAVSGFIALSFICYGVYAHQWPELSAMRHLGKPPQQDSFK
jgi:hypothetical protein